MKVSEDFVGRVLVEDVPKNAYVRFFRAGKLTNKVYRMDGWCRFNRAYDFADLDDISRNRLLRKGTWVQMIDY